MSRHEPKRAASAARRAARDVLCAYLVADPRSARLGSRKRPFPPPSLEPRERAFARTLAEGVVRRRSTLDAIVRELANGKTPRPVGVRVALLLGAWQLLFHDATPGHVAVHESVELARQGAGEGGARFVNAILRKIAAEPTLESWIPRPSHDCEDVETLARYWSFPPGLVERWLRTLGRDDTARVLSTFANQPSLPLRANRLRTNRDELAARLASEEIESRPGPHPLSLLVPPNETSRAVLETTSFRQGLFSIQDASQTEIVDMLDLTPGLRVLDFCAAPGGKSTAIAEALENDGEVFSFDTSPERLAPLHDECPRLGLTSVRVFDTRADLDAACPPASVDRLLIDAPCSNTGVLGRRVEARWRFDESRLAELTAAQQAIVADAVPFLKPNGRLVYATCSIEPEENEQLAERLAESHGLRLISCERTLPEAGLCDGSGVAVFAKLPG